MKRIILLVIFCIIFIVVLDKNALAYIDPGSGSMLLQMLLAVIIGTFFYFRDFVMKIIKSIKKKIGLRE